MDSEISCNEMEVKFLAFTSTSTRIEDMTTADISCNDTGSETYIFDKAVLTHVDAMPGLSLGLLHNLLMLLRDPATAYAARKG